MSADGIAPQDAPKEAPTQDVWGALEIKGGNHGWPIFGFHSNSTKWLWEILGYVFGCFDISYVLKMFDVF